MPGLTQLPSGSWRAVVSVPGGTPIRKSFPTYEDAAAWKSAELATMAKVGPRVRAAKLEQRGTLTVAAWFEQWLDEAPDRKISQRTKAKYRAHFNGHVRDYLGSELLADITGYRLDRYGLKLEGIGLAQSTRARTFSMLRAMFNAAIHAGRCDEPNPVAAMKDRPGMPNLRARYADATEVAALAAWLDERHPTESNGAILTTLFHTGMRISEVLGLVIGDLHFDAREIHSTHQLGRDTNGTREPLKMREDDQSVHVLGMSETVASLLAPIVAGRDADEFVFLGPRRGRWINYGWLLRERLHPALKACGLEGQGFGFHSIRHGAATHAAAEGATPEEIRDMLNQRNVLTGERYRHSTSSAPARLAAMFDHA